MTKLVSLSENAYRTLLKMKVDDMSFSDVVLKLVKETTPKRNFLKLAGALKSESAELERFKKQVERDRRANMENA
jgi:predicted CopG family antitoxin